MSERDWDIVSIPYRGIFSERDASQAWFWTPEWQAKERIAEEEIRRGDVRTFDSVEELIADLQEAEGAEALSDDYAQAYKQLVAALREFREPWPFDAWKATRKQRAKDE